MKRIFIAGIAVASSFATVALAADLPAPVYTKAPPPVVAVYDWTGFYAGVNIGYSWGRSSTLNTYSDATSDVILGASALKFDVNGVIGGGQIGYNWQRDRWVFGLEADIQGSGERGTGLFSCAGGTLGGAGTLATLSGCTVGHLGDTAPFNIAAFPVNSSLTEKLDWFGTFRGRVGGTVTPTVLLYATGGLAYGELKTTDTVTGINIVGPQGVNGGTTNVGVASVFGTSSTRAGWTVGAGVEGVISGNWTAKAEYLYMDLGSVSGTFVTPLIAPSGAFVATSYSSHFIDNILRVGVNYKFSGPAVASY
jgi:outer membrane immunogenic protein